jgi:hypothetical protein
MEMQEQLKELKPLAEPVADSSGTVPVSISVAAKSSVNIAANGIIVTKATEPPKEESPPQVEESTKEAPKEDAKEEAPNKGSSRRQRKSKNTADQQEPNHE